MRGRENAACPCGACLARGAGESVGRRWAGRHAECVACRCSPYTRALRAQGSGIVVHARPGWIRDVVCGRDTRGSMRRLGMLCERFSAPRRAMLHRGRRCIIDCQRQRELWNGHGSVATAYRRRNGGEVQQLCCNNIGLPPLPPSHSSRDPEGLGDSASYFAFTVAWDPRALCAVSIAAHTHRPTRPRAGSMAALPGLYAWRITRLRAQLQTHGHCTRRLARWSWDLCATPAGLALVCIHVCHPPHGPRLADPCPCGNSVSVLAQPVTPTQESTSPLSPCHCAPPPNSTHQFVFTRDVCPLLGETCGICPRPQG